VFYAIHVPFYVVMMSYLTCYGEYIIVNHGLLAVRRRPINWLARGKLSR